MTTARETARAGAPLETCLLGDDGLGNHRYSLEALFGVYATRLKAGYAEARYTANPTPADVPKGQLRDDGAYWGTAAYPVDGGERAVFVVRRTSPRGHERATAAERTYARTVLRTFAERSAKAHGCAAPTTP
ncbi:hypothetical protein [Streptomyces sp. NPDC001165]|uniref:hypothetical protein n=1 Tax=Streptomyces sp. NPDC001165 TaxID=3364546 RepID=UPI0036A1291C